MNKMQQTTTKEEICQNWPSDIHIRHLMLCWYKRGVKATRASAEINEAYENGVSTRTIQRWFQRFQEGDFNLEDRLRSGRPQQIDDDKLVETNPRYTTSELAEILNCSRL